MTADPVSQAAPPLADGLFGRSADGELHLRGGVHRATGRIVFPFPEGGEEAGYDSLPLPRRGTLWSFTIQRFPPVAPPYAVDISGGFTPFALGYVELDGPVIVETRLLADSFDDLRIGTPAELALETLVLLDRGPVTSFAFRVPAA